MTYKRTKITCIQINLIKISTESCLTDLVEMLGKVVDSVVGVAGGKLQFIYLIFIKTI
jgi:hypothetical protein